VTLKRILALTFMASIVSSELLCCISLTKAFPWNAYYSYSEIESELFSLESSGIARVQSIGVSVEGRPIWAIKISDDPDVEDPT
jgi:hypothetical protein